MRITWRPYLEPDAEATWRVFHDAIHGTAIRDYTPQQLEAWAPIAVDPAEWNGRRRRAWTVVAEIDGVVAGFSDLTDDGMLDMLFVHPRFAGQGVARVLVATVIAEARRRGLETVRTRASITARGAFERFGFVVDRENTENRIRGQRLTNYDMHLDLV